MSTSGLVLRAAGAALALVAFGLAAGRAAAVPAFAEQTGQPCAACHVGAFGPQLTPYGREFKLRGYTTRTVKFNVPLSAMAVASYINTAKGQPTPPATSFRDNDNVALDQVSLFLAGGWGQHFGGFVQATYDGVAKAFHWDNLDLRATTNATWNKVNMVLGLSLNNAPTVQDVFNTLPAWGYPYTTSSLAPAPGAAPLVGSLAQTTLGLTAYAWINDEVYAEAGGYWSPSPSFLTHAGADPTSPGAIQGAAPYARVAFNKNLGDRNFEVGAFWMQADIFPGLDRTTGFTDRYDDRGLDGSFQLFAAKHDVFTVNARYTNERQRLNASTALGLANSPDQTLQDARIDASYYWRDEVGLTVGAFDTWGSADPVLYSSNRTLRPDSAGLTFQIDATPFGRGRAPLGPRFNVRVGAQYTDYLEFDGAARNYDGFGRNARDNNTFRVFTWVAY
ncbi:MAG TPA: hypothetical protein VKU90_07015 [Caulobacteraceae bacterium]|nr:hypothetical protein [Caulobacteraceae bacterium]